MFNYLDNDWPNKTAKDVIIYYVWNKVKSYCSCYLLAVNMTRLTWLPIQQSNLPIHFDDKIT